MHKNSIEYYWTNDIIRMWKNSKRRMHKHSSFKLSITHSFPTCDVYGNQPCCKRQKAFKVIRLSYYDTEQSKLQGIHCVECQIFHFFIPVNQDSLCVAVPAVASVSEKAGSTQLKKKRRRL